MIPPGKTIIEDTDENREICRKYCTICPNYKTHQLGRYEPDVLFCARGSSTCPDKKEIRCFCVGCEVFLKNHLRVGYFCTHA